MNAKDINPWKNFYRIQRVKVNGKKFIVKSYGLCQWSKIVFISDDSKEFYALIREITKEKDEDTIRREYFFGKLIREYLGWQPCFVEFLNQLQQNKKNTLLLGNELGITPDLFSKYTEFYKKCFERNYQ